MVRVLLALLLLVGGVAHADEVTARFEEALHDRDVAKVTALLARDVKRDGIVFTRSACRGQTLSRRMLATCLVKENIAVTVTVEGERVTAIAAQFPVLTTRELMDLYTRVGRKLQGLDHSAAQPLFSRFRILQVQRMIATPDERARGGAALLAIERDADRI